MSRRRHAARPKPPAPHRLGGAEAAVVIIIVIAAMTGAVQGLESIALLQFLTGAVLIAVGAIGSLRYGRRITAALPWA
jgi:hypothetical protein